MDHYRKSYPIDSNDSTSSSSDSVDNTFVFGKAFQRRVKFEDTATAAKTKTFRKKSSKQRARANQKSESSENEERFWESRNKNKRSAEKTMDLKKQEEFKERLMQLVQDNLSQQSNEMNDPTPTPFSSQQQQQPKEAYRPGSGNQAPGTVVAEMTQPSSNIKSILKPRRYIYTTAEDYEVEKPIPYNGVKVSSLVASRLLSAHGIRWVTPHDGDFMTPLQQKMVAGTESLPLSRFLQNIPLPVRRSIAEIGRDSKKSKSPWRFQ